MPSGTGRDSSSKEHRTPSRRIRLRSVRIALPSNVKAREGHARLVSDMNARETQVGVDGLMEYRPSALCLAHSHEFTNQFQACMARADRVSARLI